MTAGLPRLTPNGFRPGAWRRAMHAMHAMVLPLALGSAAIPAHLATSHPAPRTSRRIATTFPLTRATDGVDGRIELLEDARITPAIHTEFWETGLVDCGDAATTPDTLRAPCAIMTSAAPALVRVVASDGRVLDTHTLERPLATLAVDTLEPSGRPTYLVTTDMSFGMGSYSGPATELGDVHDGHITWAMARDARTGRTSQIWLARTLKTDWHTAPRRDHQPGKDILMIACRPDFSARVPADSAAFAVELTRLSMSDRGWTRYTSRHPGCWEADDPFPPASAFP